jgi:uncharacterized protein YaaR (DUF327 family)
MANIVFPDGSSPLFNPAAYSEAGVEARKTKAQADGKTGKVKKKPFSSLFEAAREAAAPEKLPLSEESLNRLLDDVHSSGDALSKRPFPDEIKAYRQAVRNFVNYVVENSFDTEEHSSGTNLLARKKYTLVTVIDKKLEDLAAAIIRGQADQLAILAREDEIRGLLIDLKVTVRV